MSMNRDLTGQPLTYKGFSGKCDAAGSAKRAAESNTKAEDITPGRDAPQVVTGLGCIGQVSMLVPGSDLVCGSKPIAC